MPWLKKGRTFMSNVTGRCYRVASDRIAQGGFGEVYRGTVLDDHRDPVGKVAIKACIDPHTWHGEAYFGRLLADQPHVVRLHEAFPIVDGSGHAQQTKYVLIFDWLEDGTVWDMLGRTSAPWSEKVVVKQVAALLRVLTLPHRRGICHADITPRNVFVEGKRLLLGDLGIAKQSLHDGPIGMDYRAPRSSCHRTHTPAPGRPLTTSTSSA
jgi:serine/threonine protein kinase